MSFWWALTNIGMQKVSYRIWTRIVDSIFNNNNRYAKHNKYLLWFHEKE